DGDLDIFLLNHAIHTQESFGHADLRHKRSFESGDKLLRNDGEKFTDVSEEAGIFGGINGYGLGIAVSDFNSDGYPDIYIGNDFHEDDYYYLNQRDGTFKESLKEYFGFTSRFSMGNDVADLNHDGRPDILSLDMLPQDETVLKSSEGDDNLNIMRIRTGEYGYHYQFTRNMLQIGSESGQFAETALLSGIAATDWSWSGLFADYDQDGEQDLFVANGIPRRPNDLDYIRFVSDDQIKNKIGTTKLVDQKALEMMPSGAVQNFLYKGADNLTFTDKSKSWLPDEKQFSTSVAIGDLDLDGDLDMVINNVNGEASIYQNQTNESANYLKISFDLEGKNAFGLGTKVFAYTDGKLHFKELYTVRGFQASSEPVLHFGFGETTMIDSLRIIWPDNTTQVLQGVQTNQLLEVSKKNPQPYNYPKRTARKKFHKVEDMLGINFTHKEDPYIDFDRQKLMPYQTSDRGPATAVGDLNGDGLEDIFFGGSKHTASVIYFQSESGFVNAGLLDLDSAKEDISAIISDFNGDQKNDLIIGTGGADYYGKMDQLLDAIYYFGDERPTRETLTEAYENATILIENDFDQDGDLDVFVGNHVVTNDFGKIPISTLLENKSGQFVVKDQWELGMVTDAKWADYDADGDQDLIVVGEWMTPKVLINDYSTFSVKPLIEGLSGLWQAVEPFDIDEDGDLDFLLGNWGLNSKFNASKDFPLRMYYSDFDGNGSTETILAAAKEGKYYTLESKNGLTEQLVYLRKKYTDYKSFAGKTVEEIFERSLDEATLFEVSQLQSGFLRNENGNFVFVPFEIELQLSPILEFLSYDFDEDGKVEVLSAGNYFGVKPYHGRFGSFNGAMIESDNEIRYGDELGLDFLNKSIRHLNVITVQGETYLIVTVNNGRAQVYQF
ncbi:MAG: VCBS repeat-containing protein, partial [Cyclobacteriaceae bacterium]